MATTSAVFSPRDTIPAAVKMVPQSCKLPYRVSSPEQPVEWSDIEEAEKPYGCNIDKRVLTAFVVTPLQRKR
ncbi:predicted protein [Sclerotinia sclerotiorum 1980 UF-70]|uniref:Uncharacterized protein n=2 Tax=Sclerotinia sclerotiorum (strain ATCC 18683 / 1980 / Ss-1) TaxID=665079 RepID=A7E5J8_SCLS1|nr:predicted protein [Sclerotinia sclerotiorum 1980 UF-70]EDN91170.1 predicted protein [Sclerotinia sclerotiorum 1980 UF-70]